MKPSSEFVWRHPNRVSGALCFRGTRVPVETLVNYLQRGRSLDAFLVDFPSVPRSHVEGYLTQSLSALTERLDAEPELSAQA